jgi:hypothetical protein
MRMLRWRRRGFQCARPLGQPDPMIALPLLAVQSGHSGIVHPRTGPELSDIALFVFAVMGVFLVRRALRKRFAKTKPPAED